MQRRIGTINFKILDSDELAFSFLAWNSALAFDWDIQGTNGKTTGGKFLFRLYVDRESIFIRKSDSCCRISVEYC